MPFKSYYDHVNGAWLTRTVIPDDARRWGTFPKLRKLSENQAHGLLKTSDDPLLKLFYRAGTNVKRRQQDGDKPLAPLLTTIEHAQDLFTVILFMHRVSIPFLFGWGPFEDPNNPKGKRIGAWWPASGYLHTQAYYLKAEHASIRTKYKTLLAWVAKRLGLPNHRQVATKILALETKLARHKMKPEDAQDPEKYINLRRGPKACAAHPVWALYAAATPGWTATWCLMDPKAWDNLTDAFDAVPLATWKAYAAVCVGLAYGKYLDPTEWGPRLHAFYGKTLSGLAAPPPLWKQVLHSVPNLAKERLSKQYVKEHVDPSTKRKVTAMVESMRQVYVKRVKQLDWMSPSTKKLAVKKLQTMKVKVAYPTRWHTALQRGLHRSLEKLHDGARAPAYATYMVRARGYENAVDWHKIGQKPDPDGYWFYDWQVYTVNACYMPEENSMTYPASILQPPFFDPDASDAQNYGGIGTVIGHEMTHALDNHGAQYDHHGRYVNWWTQKDARTFQTKASALVKQFNGVDVNGALTLGENIADYGGIRLALDALNPQSKQELRAFFRSFAVTERSKARPAVAKLQLLTDPHSPPRWRVDAILPHFDAFYEAYPHVDDPDHPLYIPAHKRLKLW